MTKYAGAAAKDRVVAHLENPAALRGAPGTKVTLVWKLRDLAVIRASK